MSAGGFQDCNAFTKKEEGGWSNNGADPGGATKWGITHGTFSAWLKSKGLPDASVADMTMQQADEIYKNNYWNAVNAEALPKGVDLAVYDAAVNNGPGRAKGWAVQAASPNAVKMVKGVCALRLGFDQSLKIWKTFGKGWSGRIARVEAKGVAWAMAAQGISPGMAKVVLNNEATAAEKKSSSYSKGAATATTGGVAGTGDVVANPQHADVIGGYILGGLFIVVVALVAVLVVRSIIHNQRAKAYKDEAATK